MRRNLLALEDERIQVLQLTASDGRLYIRKRVIKA
jgi:hypothetical protein